MTINEIYELFTWDPDVAPEENAAREAKAMAEARKLKNLYPLIQPIIVSTRPSKSAWVPCAKLIAERTDDELEPYLFKLLEWIKDMNWPGADIIFERLWAMPDEMIENHVQYCKKLAAQVNHTDWMEMLDELI